MYIVFKPTCSAHGRPQKFLQCGERSRHFAYPFQVVGDATQMDVGKTLYRFFTTKKIPILTATAANSVSSKNILH